MAGSAGANIGIMNASFFVGRKAILEWLNTTFETSFSKIEETSNGAITCQIADAVFGDVPMSKVRWDARTPAESINNYKVLQSAFNKHAVPKHVDVQKLIRGKYQDNLEMMQWAKNWFELNTPPDLEYDAEQAERTPAGGRSSRPAPARRGADRASSSALAGAQRRIASLTDQVAELKMGMEGLEKERTFYYSKLRDLEILFNAYDGPDETIAGRVLKILYATEEDFVIPGEGEEGEEEEAEAVDESPERRPEEGEEYADDGEAPLDEEEQGDYHDEQEV